ncbi:ABC transporter permease [Streptomyces sp. NPDC086182]|uniref:ABC transporter permease n=1 Tax=Streptomyces sp. NPDC086182 TaxID=3155058 RepID=UPI003424A45C
MKRDVRLRGWVETVAAAVSAGLFVLTLTWPAWIEVLFGIDPDQHSGAFEWAVVTLSVCATVLLSLLARGEWRRAHAPRTE